MTGIVALVFLALIVAFGWLSMTNVRRSFDLAGDYQLALTRRVGGDLDDRLQTALDTLATAGKMPLAGPAGDRAAAQRWLDDRAVLRSAFFDKGLFLFDRTGELVAASAPVAEVGRSADLRRWVGVALKLDEPLIGLPGRYGTPAKDGSGLLLPMATPIHAGDGSIAGAVAGVADIQRESLLGNIRSIKLGESGYLFVAAWDGSVLAHPDQGLLLRQDRPVVAADVLAAASHGFRGPVETVDSAGEPVLSTFVKLQSTGWVLGASYPTREAYAQLRKQQRDVVLFIVLGTLGAALATWLLMRAFVSPMQRFADRMGDVNGATGMLLTPMPISRRNREMASLERSFNKLVARLNEERAQTYIAATVFRNVREGILVTDAAGRVVSCNPACEDITGFKADELTGQAPTVLDPGRHDEDFYAQVKQSLGASGSWRGEVWSRRKSGEIFPVMLNITAARNDKGAVAHYVGIFSDISELMRHRRRLEIMATTDPLTGLPNRALLTDRLKQAVAHADRLGNSLGVAFVDLDGFKEINDQEGHHVGDQLLVEVAERFGRSIRLGDTAARLGGDEFVLLLNNVGSRDMALGVLGRILEAVAAPHSVDGRQVSVSASIGVTFYPEDRADPDTLLRHADHAMYQAKSLGRARVHVFDPAYDRLFQSHQALLEELRRGIRRGELVLHYQPKVNLLTRQMTGVEALLRWNHPERGFLLPGQFIDEICDDDVISEVGDWVLAETCRQLTAWQADGRHRFSVSVNLSPRHLVRQGFAESLRRTIQGCPGVQFGALEIEIIESDTLQDLGCLERVIRECQDLGVRFSLDDFGTGYSSLSHLKNIPGDIIKIDRSFVINMLAVDDDLAIVEGIIRLGHVFKREVVAEGIESEAHIEQLCRLGCHLGQGYGIARPMPAEDVLPWLRERAPRPPARA